MGHKCYRNALSSARTRARASHHPAHNYLRPLGRRSVGGLIIVPDLKVTN